MPVGDLITGGILVAVLGGVTAGATLRIAQHASGQLSRSASEALEAEQDEVRTLLLQGASPH